MKHPLHRKKGTAEKNRLFPLKSSLNLLLTIILSIAFFLILVPTVQAEENLTCGVILPLSGDLGKTGTDILHGIEIAADELNAKSTLSGYQVSLRVADDKGDPDTALSLFQDMEADGVPVVIGSYSTTLTLPLAEESANTDSTLLISPQANGEALYGISPFFYQVNPPVFPLAEFISDWLLYTSDRPAIIYTDDAYGNSMMEQTRSDLIDTLPDTGIYPLPDGDSDYTAFIESVLDQAPDAVVIIIYDSRQIPVIRNLSLAGFTGQVLLTESSYLETLKRNESDVLSRFPLFTISSYANFVPGEHTDRFISSYTKKYGEIPNMTLAGYGYDSLMVIADALRNPARHENITVDRIRDGLSDSRYYGVTGPKVFDKNNAPESAMDRWAFRDGEFVRMTTSLV